MPVSPDIANYHIGKGIVSASRKPAARTSSTSATRRRSSTRRRSRRRNTSRSREGINTKDFTAITQVGATVKFTLDEITGLNLSFFALADQGTDSDGNITLSGLSKSEFIGDIKVVGTNDIGQQVDFLATVSFSPSGDFSFITDKDDFTVITIEAEVQKDADGLFGVWTIREAAVVSS